MKLSRRIIMSISIALVVLFAIWAIVFTQTAKRQIYSHIDLLLTQQSDKIITRFIENDSLPNSLSGMSGTMEFFIEKVSPEYAQSHQIPLFQTDEEFIDDIQEDEIVREMSSVFQKRGIDYELTLSTHVFAWNDTLDFAIFSILTLAVALLIAIILIVSFIIIGNMRPLYRLTISVPRPTIHIKTWIPKNRPLKALKISETSNELMASLSVGAMS